MQPSTLQALTKRVLATQHVSNDDYCILKRFGLWWHDAPITLYTDGEQILIKTPCYKEGIKLNTALVLAVKENNYDLIVLFTEWGANINYALLSVNKEHTRNLCRKLGAKEGLEASEVLRFFFETKRHKTSSNIILCHELFSNNPFLQNVNMVELRMIIYWELKDLTTNLIVNEDSFTEMLTKYWYGIAVKYNLKEAIQYFCQEYEHLNEWRLICALSFNNVFDLHEICNTMNIDMNINKMMRLACMRDNNFLTIYYCFALGADINRAMYGSVSNFRIENMFFCMDLGADVFEESLELAERHGYSVIVDILSLKIYKANPILLSKETDPEKINTLLKNYYPKNMLAYDICNVDNYL
uniref:Protein MGF 360-3L n=1 Tax=African swine fever virus (isolate Pig/Kenya/KEN-50/1950) TaxID=561445 RepID=3603L_ASFK5|nr:RecName: Full=Protein MGF 360-3L [African swine fever virus pig/Kenya/KEN-50/1950]